MAAAVAAAWAVDEMIFDDVLVERITFLESLGATTFFDVEQGSVLSADDAALEPLGLSAVAQSTFLAAVQQIGALGLDAVPAPVPTAPSFGLLRGSLEAAAVTVWLLESDDPLERGVRLLSEAWGEIRDAHAMLESLGGDATAITSAREDIWVRSHRNRFGAVDTRPFQKRTPIAEKLAVAAAVVADFTQTDDYAAIIPSSWRGFDSIAQGRGESFGLTDDAVKTTMFQGSLAMLLDVVETAASLFHVRAVAASA